LYRRARKPAATENPPQLHTASVHMTGPSLFGVGNC
jgi:hypothetical protein